MDNEPINLIDDDDDFGSDIRSVINLVDDLESTTEDDEPQDQPWVAPRNGPLEANEQLLLQYNVNQICLRPNIAVELYDRTLGQFLIIKQIIQRSDGVYLRGLPFHRFTWFRSLWDHQLNEVALFLKVDQNDKRPSIVQGMVDIDANLVKRIREIAISDQNWPAHTFNIDTRIDKNAPDYTSRRRAIKAAGKLACRWIYEDIYETAAQRLKGRSRMATIRRITHDDVATLRCRRRSDSLELVVSRPNRTQYTKPRQYTFGDLFCCSGGASRGAQMAGLRVDWGVDKDPKALRSYRVNFPYAKCFQENIGDLLATMSRNLFVNVLHLSPVCKPWSAAHTVNGKDDDQNSATLYAVDEALKRIRPDCVTIEQTAGLHERHGDHFIKLLGLIVSSGYNLSYRVFDFRRYGLPARRVRIIIMASRKGVPLPEFPDYTHGPGLRPYVSMEEALRRINPRSTHSSLAYATRKNAVPYDARTYILPCITCSGSGRAHPSGKRSFTPRELARLNSVPDEHHFIGSLTDARSQIGDIYPPLIAEIMFRQCIKALDKMYGQSCEPPVRQTRQNPEGHNDRAKRHKRVQGSTSLPLLVSSRRTSSRSFLRSRSAQSANLRLSGSRRDVIVID